MDALFCLPCALFSKSKENSFTKIPGFSKWYKTGEKVKEHCSSSVHDRSISRLEEFKERFQNPQSTIPYTTDKTLQQRVEHNKYRIAEVDYRSSYIMWKAMSSFARTSGKH